MKTMKLMINGNEETVQVERYFRALNNQYLIYSKDGADIDGNVRINVVKIENNQVVPIDETTEWEAVKNVIVEIVNDNRELSKLSIEDLDYQGLENLNVTNVKALRLPSAVMPYLSANQPDFNSLEVKEQELDAKVEALKDMNQDLTMMMDEVGKEFPAATNEVQEDETAEEKMGATMEIIMPSKQIVAEPKEEKKATGKGKGHFNFKNLFGKKKNKEELELPVEEPTIQPDEPKEEAMMETTLETPVVPIEQAPAMEETPIVEETPVVEPEISLPENMPVVEEPNGGMNSGFDFFETTQENVVPEPIVVAPANQMPTEIPDIPNTPTVPAEEPMEILELEEEKYKQLYEEEQNKVAVLEAQVQALNGNIKRLEETLLQYQERVNQIKSIVD